ncbi:Acyl-CoA dehydrogenase OS=Streptomyces alboniger OX=132473 GN=CP975_29925 PE=3 SV=1 [Streptomyces alboniger]
MSEPGLGSDVAAITSKGVKDGDHYVLNGQKMWLTNGGTSTLVAVLCRSDEGHSDAETAAAPHKSMTTFLVERSPASARSAPDSPFRAKSTKWAIRAWIATEIIMDGLRIPANRVLGGTTGRGFYQMMDGVEVGRVNVAARGCGVAQRAFELGVSYAQQRHTFGKPIAQHQAIQFKLAEMATKVEAAHAMMVNAARKKDSGERTTSKQGMAKYLASEYCKEVVEDAFRIHGGYGFSKEYEIERLYREAPMLLIGEGPPRSRK